MTPEQKVAIKAFAKSHGRYWKQALNDAWMTGRYSSFDDSSSLQQLRNQKGPSWLVKFKITTI